MLLKDDIQYDDNDYSSYPDQFLWSDSELELSAELPSPYNSNYHSTNIRFDDGRNGNLLRLPVVDDYITLDNNFLVMPDDDNRHGTTGVPNNVTETIMATATPMVPRDLFFNDDTMVSVIAYSILFFVAAFGNLTVFITLFRNRHRKSRVNLFIMHLSIADMIVTFVMIPMEIGWHVTVSWKAGDVACRILMFCRPFGFYLSSFILVAISLDRYFAITHPLSINDADRRGKLMLLMAWLFSIVASVPQVC